jgi:hypothetical protein
VVAAITDEVERQGSHRVSAQALSVDLLGEKEVDARVPVHRIVLFVVLDQAHEIAVLLDHEGGGFIASSRLPAQLRLVGRTPPAGEAGFRLDLGHRSHVSGSQGPQQNSFPWQLGHRASLA